jgi:subtilisin-like proprotein convertase family protein
MKKLFLPLVISVVLLHGRVTGIGSMPFPPYTFEVNQAIPDGLLSGLSDTRTLSLPGMVSITDVQVSLTISGGFNGDYYAYLTHGTGFSVLLNRPGRTTTNPLGYADSGLDVTFSDLAADDVHLYQDVVGPGVLTGLWAPDGRNVHPATSLDTSPRTAFLTAFNGLDPNGSWTLFVADVDGGAQGQWISWGLQISAVPEPATISLTLLGGVTLVLLRRRQQDG